MNIACCPECGAERIDKVELGCLEAHYNPPMSFWKGERVKLTASENRVLYTLIRRRRASSDALAILPNGEYSDQVSVRSRITKIRRRFSAMNLPFLVESIHSYGYEIKEVAIQ